MSESYCDKIEDVPKEVREENYEQILKHAAILSAFATKSNWKATSANLFTLGVRLGGMMVIGEQLTEPNQLRDFYYAFMESRKTKPNEEKEEKIPPKEGM